MSQTETMPILTVEDLEVAYGGIPVSYTHLDVYKRQRKGLRSSKRRKVMEWT